MFSNEIVKARKECDLTQVELAHKLGVSEHTVQYWEYGMCYPTTFRLLQLSVIFKKTLDELFWEELEEERRKSIERHD